MGNRTTVRMPPVEYVTAVNFDKGWFRCERIQCQAWSQASSIPADWTTHNGKSFCNDCLMEVQCKDVGKTTYRVTFSDNVLPDPFEDFIEEVGGDVQVVYYGDEVIKFKTIPSPEGVQDEYTLTFPEDTYMHEILTIKANVLDVSDYLATIHLS